MPRKEQPQAVAPVAAWDLKIPGTKAKLWKLKDDLEDISRVDPETKGYEFGFWLVKKGYVKIDGNYNRIDRIHSEVLGRTYKQVWFTSVRKGYQSEAVDMYDALKKLLAQQRFAKKQEHLAQLGGEVCPGVPGSTTNARCEMCYPMSLREMAAEKGWNLDVLKSHAVRRMPRFSKRIPVKIIETDLSPIETMLPPGDLELKKRDDMFEESNPIREQDLPF